MNKSQRREHAGQRAMEVAMESLKRIEAHEKECGERWGQAISEIKQLRAASEAHSLRWEKLAWMVVGVFLVTAATHIIELAL
jgi:hypothetical protein|tara:strand:- start:1127 stop:1372 length:246 start_codon:yes stop_codon:yes gene_type:complete